MRIGESGLTSADIKVKSLMNNMANARTPGYREADVVTRAFPSYLLQAEQRISRRGEDSLYEARVDKTYYNLLPGSLQPTGNDLDLAIEGDGFFAIQAPWGEAYTRDGRVSIDKDGRLVTVAGNFLVMGQKGPIAVTPGAKIVVSERGEILLNDQLIDRLKIATFAHPERLQYVNGIIFRLPDTGLMAEIKDVPRIRQGFVEAANVNVINQMVDLIMLSRAYGINTKVIQTRDVVLSRALEMGKPAQ